MDSTTHTPGPWAVDSGDGGDPSVGVGPTPTTVFINVPNDDRFRVVEIATVNDTIYDNDEDGHPLYCGDPAANARLIAAAPELLAIVKALVAPCIYERQADRIAEARRIIARVEATEED